MASDKKNGNNRIAGARLRLKAICGSVINACRPYRVPIIAAAAVLVTAIAVVSVTTSWFETNRKDVTRGESVTSDMVDPSVLPYTLYIKDRATAAVSHYTSTQNAVLNSYDAILGGDSNAWTSAYIRMPVYGILPGDSLSFTVTCTAPLYVTEDNVTHINESISNFIEIRCANIPASTLAADAAETTVYDGALAWFRNNSAQEGAFVQYHTPANADPRDPVQLDSKSTSITFQFADGTYTIEEDGMVYIYFMIDYDYNLVDAYLHELRGRLGGFKLNEAGHAEFAGLNDLERIQMTVSHPD